MLNTQILLSEQKFPVKHSISGQSLKKLPEFSGWGSVPGAAGIRAFWQSSRHRGRHHVKNHRPPGTGISENTTYSVRYLLPVLRKFGPDPQERLPGELI